MVFNSVAVVTVIQPDAVGGTSLPVYEEGCFGGEKRVREGVKVEGGRGGWCFGDDLWGFLLHGDGE